MTTATGLRQTLLREDGELARIGRKPFRRVGSTSCAVVAGEYPARGSARIALSASLYNRAPT